jgi:phage-related protein
MSKRSGEMAHMTDAAPMEQVRDLLFGAQLKEMEMRFQRQEERFQRDIADARDMLKNRIDSLENFMKSETASLLYRIKEEKAEGDAALKGEQRERAEAIAQIVKDMASTAESFDRKLAKASGALDTVEQELRRLLLSETGALSGKIEEKYQDALKSLQKTAADIRHDMVARSSLSSMFTEVAFKLSGQWSSDINRLLTTAQTDMSEYSAEARDASGDASGDA